MDRDDVCVLLPTLDEAETVGSVVDGFRDEGFENVLVVDGHSTDGTRDIARERGARVIEQSGVGKGQAVREGLDHVDASVVLMADADGTYRPEDAEAMLEPIFAGRAEHVIGNRFAEMETGAMTRLNRAGNRLVNRAFSTIHGRNLRDILSGYRAFTRDSIERYSLRSEGFGIETELCVECVKHGTPTEVVPVSYRARPDDSETNLHPVRDGANIFLTLYKLAKTNNPLFYFGSVGVVSGLVGFLVATYVGYDYLVNGISHEALAVVAAAGIILGVQLVMFGVLSDIIVAVNREQTRRLEELAEQLSAREPVAARPAAGEPEAARTKDAAGDAEPDGAADAPDDQGPPESDPAELGADGED
ncbi:MAG: S-layer glycoprotein N-glycosyltransferase AglJ [Haloglomus sp.]